MEKLRKLSSRMVFTNMKRAKRSSGKLCFERLAEAFKRNVFRNEDDVKLNFHSDILKPLILAFNPEAARDFKSEDKLLAGGRTDATFQNVTFEYKKYNYFRTEKGRNEALFGRNDKDHGLYDYVLGNSGVQKGDPEAVAERKITGGIGVGFDGCRFLFARFVQDDAASLLQVGKAKVSVPNGLRLKFVVETKSLSEGVAKLALIVKQQTKVELTKQNVLAVVNAKSDFVRNSIFRIYKELEMNLKRPMGSARVKTLYKEWDRVFGIMYGNDEEATDFTEVSSAIRNVYGIPDGVYLDSKVYLFALQTFFNMFLKLLVYSFLAQLVDPAFSAKQSLTKAEIDRLFDGTAEGCASKVSNFFEAHFLEWFTFTAGQFEVEIINSILEKIDRFDLSTFVLKPENVQDILQEVYMELIPEDMRHLMGEYFSPDWIVEHALDMVGYNGDIKKSLIDPTAGSGPFLTQALKRIIAKKGGTLSRQDLDVITRNVVGFDINPISVVAAKANYILILFSAYFQNVDKRFGDPIDIPVFIADSILAPVVYTEENGETLKLRTSVGDLLLPKFADFRQGNEFLTRLSLAIHEKGRYENFKRVVLAKKLISRSDEPIVRTLFDRLYVLHRAGHDSFWPIILRNSYAPIMIGNKFDYVVGNPPWIAWKSMSKSYREGTLKIWQSYGIFEKNAYDKKTTHDDFGMAVTYVAVDQYLKDGGDMVFLLPASFLKSTKGGEGFRKFKIVRNGQDVPFAVEEVHDFSDVKLFTIATSAIKFHKGRDMEYPMPHYRTYHQLGKHSAIDTHWDWGRVARMVSCQEHFARPIDVTDPQSAWLTLDNMDFANKITDPNRERYYRGRKGIEPAGAKGVYILRKPERLPDGRLRIENDVSRQRRKDVVEKGVNIGAVEPDFIFPMLGGRNIEKWRVKSHEYMILPHTAKYKYGIPEEELAENAPDTYTWLDFYRAKLLETRMTNGKFFNPKTNPFYRLDNVGPYTFAPYKVLWKEQAGAMSAVVVSSYLRSIPDADKKLFNHDKPIVVDSKVLMLGLENEMEAYYVCGVINAPCVTSVIDGYAIGTNRGIDVLKNVAIPRYDPSVSLHCKIAKMSRCIHVEAVKHHSYFKFEKQLDKFVCWRASKMRHPERAK